MESIQYRLNSRPEFEADAESRLISGYGIVFNSDSHPLVIHDDEHGSVRVVEQITRKSIERADISDVISAYNHNFEKILGRTTSATMTLSTDSRGVKYTVSAGKQSYADDLLESLRRGDVAGSSFVFTYDMAEGYELQDRKDGTVVAIPRRITKIYEMGPVTTPAYPETTAENRNSGLEKAVKRHLAERKKEDTPDEKDEEEESSGADGMAGRAMDVMDMCEAVSSAFYREFDFKEDEDGNYDYYYVQSIALDNTMVVKSGRSKKLWQLGYSISEAMDVEFTPKSEWIEVKREFTPVRMFADMETAKRKVDEKNLLVRQGNPAFVPDRYYELKRAAKRRV